VADLNLRRILQVKVISLNRESEEMEKIKVVVRFSDGQLIKGFTDHLFPTERLFYLTPVDNPSVSQSRYL